MKTSQPLDYVEDFDQLDELKHSHDLDQDEKHPDLEIIDIQEDDYMLFD
jgi:hypothetical protein